MLTALLVILLSRQNWLKAQGYPLLSNIADFWVRVPLGASRPSQYCDVRCVCRCHVFRLTGKVEPVSMMSFHLVPHDSNSFYFLTATIVFQTSTMTTATTVSTLTQSRGCRWILLQRSLPSSGSNVSLLLLCLELSRLNCSQARLGHYLVEDSSSV